MRAAQASVIAVLVMALAISSCVVSAQDVTGADKEAATAGPEPVMSGKDDKEAGVVAGGADKSKEDVAVASRGGEFEADSSEVVALGSTPTPEFLASRGLFNVPSGPARAATGRAYGGWNNAPNTQYHIQTDEGPERYFKYQTMSGQYRKEKRLPDGTVVGTYGWVDPNGYLRLRDYVADGTGYRVVKTKMVYVGKDTPIDSGVSKAKNVPSQGGTGYVPPKSSYPFPAAPFATQQSYTHPQSIPQTSYTGFTSPSSSFFQPYQSAPSNSLPNYNVNNFAYSEPKRFGPYEYRQPAQQQQQQYPLYDGISATSNGFQYYLPRQYHQEENLPGQQSAGSFGYIDPFGIRRVVYYNTAPDGGFVHRKNNRYVGFDSTPYDPRF